MSNTKYDSGLCEKVIRLYLKEDRSIQSLTEEFNLGSVTPKYWIDKYHKGCSSSNKCIQQLEELQKENRFFKKAATFFT